MEAKNRILIADDHSIVRLGLVMLLKDLGCRYVKEVSTCKKLESEVRKGTYTHLILDLIMGDGNSIDLIPEYREKYPKMQILVHSMQPAEVFESLLRKYNIYAFASKTMLEAKLKELLLNFINKVNISDATPIKYPRRENPFRLLTLRELEILHLMLNGVGTKHISLKLGTKMNTISTFKSIIFDKLSVNSIPQLLQLADLYEISY